MKGIKMEFKKDKINFCALRNEIGVSAASFAEMLGVRGRTVFRWENLETDANCLPSGSAWKLLYELKDLQNQVYTDALQRIQSIENEQGHAPDTITLTYYRSQNDYDTYHVPHDNGDFRIANASARLCAHALRVQGYNVVYVEAKDNPVYKHTTKMNKK